MTPYTYWVEAVYCIKDVFRSPISAHELNRSE